MLRTHYSRLGRRQWSLENPGVPHPLDVPARLDEFKELRDGWADGMQVASDWGNGYGKAPDHAGLDWLADTFERRYPDDAPLPYAYPTPEGGVQIEWSLGPYEASVEIDINDHSAEWFVVDLPADTSDERMLNLDIADDWAWFANEIRRLAKASE